MRVGRLRAAHVPAAPGLLATSAGAACLQIRSQRDLRATCLKTAIPHPTCDGETRTRTGDTTIFSRVLYQLSYLASAAERLALRLIRPRYLTKVRQWVRDGRAGAPLQPGRDAAGGRPGRPLSRARPAARRGTRVWEIGPGGCEVRALRGRLGLDSGHASRLLRALEADGMATVAQGGHDRRVRTAKLTPAGLAERALLDRRAGELAEALLAPLTGAQRERLVGAMRDVERLLTAAMVEIVAVDPEHPDARQCLRSYFAELERRSGARFDPLVGSTAEPHELRPPAGEMVVAYLRAEPVGCGALKHVDGAVTDIKRMWLAEAARGLGLGRRLLETLEQRAARAGARTVRLETSGLLVEAVALYRSAGYLEVPAFNDEPFAHHWFEKRLP